MNTAPPPVPGAAPRPPVDRFGRVHTDLRVSLAVAGKGPGHAIGSARFVRPDRPMSAIGG
ncbi:hypothetical protein ACFWJ4_26805 [Kitasatospora sp. NPDC127067]|uniref:hypothetical protein n=1 Tax=Kitasatospora sp. NPDC127067 TaxID=3347126 RepID=UPI003669F723